MKQCIKCGRMLDLCQFNANPTYKDGRAGKCRECCKAYLRAYAATHKEEARARRRAHYLANRETILAKSAAVRLSAEERRPKRQAYYARNRERIIAKAVDTTHRRRAGGGHVSAAEWRAICERHRNCCVYCGRDGKLTRDHLMPLSRGGRHVASNIVPACQRCNSSKGIKTSLEWAKLRHPDMRAPFTPFGAP